MSPDTFRKSLILAALLGVLTFLFAQARSNDPKMHHQIVVNIQNLHYQNSRLNESVLEFSADQFSNYDLLTRLKSGIREYLTWFKSEEPKLYGIVDVELDAIIDRAESNFEKKFSLIEKFKSHNGILKNSLYYIPTAVDNLQKQSSLSSYHQNADKLLQEVLLFNSRLNPKNKELGENIIEEFRSKKISRLDDIAIHAETIFRERMLLQEIVEDLFSIPTKDSVENIYQEYSAYNNEKLQILSVYRTAMYTIAVLLLFYVIYLFYTLRQTLLCLEDSLYEVEFQKNALDQYAIVASISAEGIVTYANEKFTQTTQLSKEQIVGKSRRILESEFHDQAYFDHIWSELESGKRWRGEIKNKRKDNTEYWLDATVVPFLDKKQKPIRYVALLKDITEKKAADSRIYRLAHYDALTGLPNRAMFLESLNTALVDARQSKSSLAVLFIDLDNFKLINDTMGHASGDELLNVVAEHLRSSVRASDIVARLGGDEFTVIVRDVEMNEHIENIVQNILSITKDPVTINQKEIIVSSSIGVSVFPDDATDTDTLLKNADIAMYKAKSNGKNNCCIFDEELKAINSEKHALENDLLFAVRNEQFVLHYQPQVDVLTGRICAVEALIRWNHPEKGLIQPNAFIPMLEESGLIIEVGKWVLIEACTQLAQWKELGINLGMGVNVSARQLQDGHILELLKQILDFPGIEPSDIDLEITETGLLGNADELIALLSTFKDLGVKLSLDDFGTGYSSLNYLKKLPISKLKIDQSFVRDIPFDAHDMAIAKTVIAMASSLDLKVVAEGVETVEQIQFLEEHGCDFFQGYYFNEPVDARTMQQLLINWNAEQDNYNLRYLRAS